MKDSYCNACGQDLVKGDLSISCRFCLYNYHPACWAKVGGCITPGCQGRCRSKGYADFDAAKVNHMRCPGCGEKILDFAVRCRYCRTFLHNNHEQQASYNKKKQNSARKKRKDPVLTFLLNLVFPGAGYIYLGKTLTGVIWCLIACAAYFIARPFGVVAILAWVLFDSTRQAVIMNNAQRNRSL